VNRFAELHQSYYRFERATAEHRSDCTTTTMSDREFGGNDDLSLPKGMPLRAPAI
jgi:hypothetical protein